MTSALPLSRRAPISDLARDEAILRRLLHRNSNQHRCTKLFGYLNKIQKTLSSVSGVGEATDKEDSELELRLISAYSEIAYSSLRCFTMVRQYLKERLFLPLYTTLLALSASILHASCILLVDYHDRCRRKSDLPPLPFGVELGHSVVMGRLTMSVHNQESVSSSSSQIIETKSEQAGKGSANAVVSEKEVEEEEAVLFDMGSLGKRKQESIEEVETSAGGTDLKPKKKKKKKKKKELEGGDEIDEIFKAIVA